MVLLLQHSIKKCSKATHISNNCITNIQIHLKIEDNFSYRFFWNYVPVLCNHKVGSWGGGGRGGANDTHLTNPMAYNIHNFIITFQRH